MTALGALARRLRGRADPPGAGPAASEPAPVPAGLAEGLVELLGGIDLAFVVTDAAGGVLHVSPRAAAMIDRDGVSPLAAHQPWGTFFGLPVEDVQQLVSLTHFVSGDEESAGGEVMVAAERRHVAWTGRVLAGSTGQGRLFVLRDVTAERCFEAWRVDLLATVSHELRTPLAALLGSLQLVLGRADALEAAEREMLDIAVKSAERLIMLLNNLLDVDRLEQGTVPFQFASVAPAALAEAAVAATCRRFEARRVRVDVAVPEDVPAVHGDRERLVQTLEHLLDNAAKYAPEGSVVSVRVHASEGGVQFDVTDEGPGVSPAEQAHVFDRFWQADRGGRDAGAGLGLAICRAIVARHGGRIWLESEEGRGTTVSFFLPRSLFRAEDGVATVCREPEAGARVLVVEDDGDARAVLRAALERQGYQVVEAASGVHGVRLARRERPAAVILDLFLPDISGYDLLRILKNSPDTAAVPVVVLSAEPERELAQRLGAWDALQKPIDCEAIRWSLARALARPGGRDGRLVMGVGPAVSRELALLAGELEGGEHQVYRAEDLGDLARWSAANYPDVLVLDHDFLGQSWDDVAERLRHPATGRPVPIVLLGSGAGGGDARQGWVQLSKPISTEDLLDAARALLAAA